MAEESDVEKTEEPTPQRREKARKEGQIPRSKELTSLLMLLAGWGLVLLGGDMALRMLAHILQSGLSFDRTLVVDTTAMLRQLRQLLGMAIMSVAPILLGMLTIALGAPSLLGGIQLGGKAFKFDVKRLNPLPGLGRMVSMQLASELLKSLLKVALVTVSSAIFICSNTSRFIRLGNGSLADSLVDTRDLISSCLLVVILSLIPMVIYDIFYQIFSNIKKLRMSRQEIRDEFKQSEGDPHIKGRIKQLQRAAARQRMMSDVPTADVIVNNPTHFSVALVYKEGNTAAPVVVAKGAGEIALRIRGLAREHNVLMLEAPPLARALYRHCDIGQAIPTELYNAVAEVLAWVYGVRRWRQAGGLRPRKPENIPVPMNISFKQASQE
ncbi:flagellar biosynthesis protein FlhB (plasmid) [Enterobacter asburiae]|uniref:flagellar biosynthesis protein FlhB n=1 Tax=Enterobacter asburiae TaxID=61645 RepID=UPI00293343CC|nr:flagellar type III secretion system protein FlhB [Enterobacter asburiae]EMA4739820.1 flagellar type III secretion system protein FlhB [Enterobacter asburiae]